MGHNLGTMGAQQRRKWDINGASDASDVGRNDGIPEIWTSFPACDLRILKNNQVRPKMGHNLGTMGAQRRRKWDINGASDASDVGHNDGIPEIWTSFPACDLRILKKIG